jgi:hypothetical protein
VTNATLLVTAVRAATAEKTVGLLGKGLYQTVLLH